MDFNNTIIDLTQSSDDDDDSFNTAISTFSPRGPRQQTELLPLPSTNNGGNTYGELLDMEFTYNYIPNYQPFECPICFCNCESMEGVTLRCVHNFCKDCIRSTIKYSEEVLIKCPYKDDNYACDILITDREIKALLTVEEFEKYLQLSLRLAESSIKNSFHCRTNDCQGWCIVENGINVFTCPICKIENCLICKALHPGFNCKQYQDSVILGYDLTNSEHMLKQMVLKGEAMNCPKCQIVIMKRDGCDSITCSMCKTMICWVTKKPRWGPAGLNDISGGCRCRVNGKLCHPKCKNCH